MRKFLRRNAVRYAKFGKGRGKKAKWRNPTGRHNKIREKIKGHPAGVNIGYGKTKDEKPVEVFNTKDLEKIPKGKKGILKNVGTRKKVEIAKKAKEMKIEIIHLNQESFLKKYEKEQKMKKKETKAPQKEGEKNEK